MGYEIIDTSLSVGVNPTTTYIAEEELEDHLVQGNIGTQIIYQPDEGFQHQTPDWNPYLGNDYIAKVEKLFPNRVLGLATIQVWHQPPRSDDAAITRNIAIEEVDRAITDLGLHGLRMHPLQHNYQFNDRQLVWPVLNELRRLQRVSGHRMLVSVYAGGDSLNCSPEAIAETARQFPDLVFLMVHSAFIWGGGTVSDVAAPLENILLDLSSMPQRGVVHEAFKRFGAKKFCLGTNGPYGTLILKNAILDDLTKDDVERRLVLGGNLARFL